MNGQVLIAVIDDDESLRSALVGLVRSLGYEAQGFSSAEDFLHADGMQSFSCIISDIQLPGMTGIDLKHSLAARDVRTPVIMVTARAEPGLEERARASGAVCFLRKPFDGNILLDQIEQVLQGPNHSSQ